MSVPTGMAARVRLLTLGAVLALVSCASMAGWLLVLRDHQTAQADFVSLAVADRLAGSQPELLYDMEVQLDLQRQLSDDPEAPPRPFVNPPFVAQLARLITAEDPTAGYVRLALANLLTLAGMGWALCRAVPTLGGLRKGVMILGMIGAFPVTTAMAEGTVSLMVGLGLSLVLLGEQEERDWWCAVGLALATMKPHLALVALAMLACRGRIGSLGRFAALGTGMVLASAATIGLKPWLNYPLALLDIGGAAAPERRFSLRWWNLLTPIRVALGPAVEPLVEGGGVLMLLAGLVAMGTLVRKRPAVPLGIGLLGTTICLPHVNGHDLTWLPVAFAMVWGAEGWQLRTPLSRALLLGLASTWPVLSWMLWPEGSSTIPVAIVLLFAVVAAGGRYHRRPAADPQPGRSAGQTVAA